MALTIHLTPKEDERLQVIAQKNGVAPAEFARQLLSKHLLPREREEDTPKPTYKQLRGYGMFAHIPGGSEVYALEKQQEIEREEKKFESRS